MFQYGHMANPFQRSSKDEDTACTVSHIFRVNLSDIAWTHRQGRMCFAKQLIGFLIHAYKWPFGVTRHLVSIQDIFHAGYEFWIFFVWDTPVF